MQCITTLPGENRAEPLRAMQSPRGNVEVFHPKYLFYIVAHPDKIVSDQKQCMNVDHTIYFEVILWLHDIAFCRGHTFVKREFAIVSSLEDI